MLAVYRYTRCDQHGTDPVSDAGADVATPHRDGARFVRAAPTRLGYGTITSYAYWLYAFGPGAVPAARGTALSYT